MNRFRGRLRKLSELYDRFVTDDPQNFFWDFPARLRDENSATFLFYERIELWLSYIPEPQWPCYVDKITETVFLYDRHRFWERLHDVFNEAFGVFLLRKDFGCQEVHFVPRKDSSTPDLAGQRGPQLYYLEVKTINHSQDECDSWYGEVKLKDTTFLPKELKDQIQGTYSKAVSQLSAPDDAETAKKIALLVLDVDCNFDPTDKALAEQICSYLGDIEKPGFEIVCHIM